jgi:hypothetical protein
VKETPEFTFSDWLKLAQSGKLEKLSRVAQQLQVIDKFVKENPKIKPVSKEKKNEEFIPVLKEKERNQLEDIVSETLARVYLEQQLFSHAKAVYQKLSLIYPEKSSYFAAQLKLIKNKESEIKK